MAKLILPIKAGVAFAGNKLTDHNRSGLSVNYTKIEYRKRMANGTERRLKVAEKRAFKLNWATLPGATNRTVDGFWGALAMQTFYKNTPQEFIMTLAYGDNSTEDVLVMFTDFNLKLNKRGSYVDFYDVDMSLDEI